MKNIKHYLLVLPWVLCLAGCCKLDSSFYRDGLIQRSVDLPAGRIDFSTSRQTDRLTLLVEPFSESRLQRSGKNLSGLGVIPIGSLVAVWDVPDWLAWKDRSFYAAYKPAGIDLAETTAQYLETALESDVIIVSEDTAASYYLRGDIEKLTLKTRSHYCGLGFIGMCLAQPGLPIGHWDIEQIVRIGLVEASSGKIVYEKTFHTGDGGIIGAYYGRYPLQYGYPARKVLMPMLRELGDDLVAHFQAAKTL